MNFTYITPKEAAEKEVIAGKKDEAYYQKLAENTGVCEVCGQPVWKLGNTGMCFPCTTGESDASDDYELIDAFGAYMNASQEIQNYD